MDSRRPVIAICLALTLVACNRLLQPQPVRDAAPPFIPPPVSEELSPGTPVPAPTQPEEPISVETGTAPTATIAAESSSFIEDPSLPRSRYVLRASLDYTAHRMEVAQEITYVNRSGESISELVLLVEPNRFPGAFQLEEIAWADGAPISDAVLEGGTLRVPLTSPLPPWKSLGLHLDFVLSVPGLPGTFGYGERQMNLGDWYPFAPLYRAGEGWLAHPPSDMRVGEFLTYDIADFQVEIRLEQPPEGLVLAASAQAEVSEDTLTYQVQGARNFVLAASPFFTVIEDATGRIPVKAYVLPEHATAGQAALDASGAAMDLFTEVFGPVARDSLAIVESEFFDGMEYDGLYFLSWSYFDTYFGGTQNFLTTLAAHETAHLWWAGLVANDQALEPWLDEALATYSEKIFFERYFPDQVDWWWEFRITLYEPDGWVDSTIYDHDAFRPYVNSVYLRGVQFLQEARELLGEEAFLAALRAYLAQNSYEDGQTEELLRLLQEQTEKSLDPLIEEYFRTGVPRTS